MSRGTAKDAGAMGTEHKGTKGSAHERARVGSPRSASSPAAQALPTDWRVALQRAGAPCHRGRYRPLHCPQRERRRR